MLNANLLLILLIAYLIGSIPFGIITARIFRIPDPRKSGSKNIGATNIARIGGRLPGVITLLLDALKGVAPVLIAKEYYSYDVAILTGIAAVTGHIFPVWLKFHGGKGVATTLAVLLALNFYTGIFACSVWLAIFAITRISSLSAIITMVLSPVFSYFLTDMQILNSFFLANFLLSIIVIFRHYSNISRLLKKQERGLR